MFVLPVDVVFVKTVSIALVVVSEVADVAVVADVADVVAVAVPAVVVAVDVVLSSGEFGFETSPLTTVGISPLTMVGISPLVMMVASDVVAMVEFVVTIPPEVELTGFSAAGFSI